MEDIEHLVVLLKLKEVVQLVVAVLVMKKVHLVAVMVKLVVLLAVVIVWK